MSDSNAPDSATDSSGKAPKKKSKLPLLAIVAFVALLAAGGGGFFMYRSKAASKEKASNSKSRAAKKNAKSDDDEAPKDEEADGEKKSGKKKSSEEDSAEVSLPDDSGVKQVVELQPFIVNLADDNAARYLRLTVSLGVGEGEGGEKPDPLFTTRVRNALLAVLTTKKSDEILTVEGKAKLRKELLRAARAASEKPQVEAIYITEFIVQL